MKKLIGIIAVFVAVCVLSESAYGWGRLGHAAIADVAQRHIAPKTADALHRYLDGIPITAISSDADDYRPYWTMDLGFVPKNSDAVRQVVKDKFDNSLPANIAPWSHSYTVDSDFVPLRTDNVNSEYVNNCLLYVDRLAARLRSDAAGMDSDERYRAIALIVHLMGDMHCPVHIVYQNRYEEKGHFNVTYKNKVCSYHSFWDSGIMSVMPWGFQELSTMVDTCTPEQIEKILDGSIYDWMERNARDCWHVYEIAHPGDDLSDCFVADTRPFLFKQIREAGYRLAALLDYIFE